GRPRSRSGRPRQLHRRPAPECGVRVDDDAESHVGVGGAAELGALTCVLTHPIGAKGDPGHVSGNGVPLAAEGWYPERVDHVCRGDGKLHGPAKRDVQLVCGDEPELLVAEFPPPLVTDHVHFEGVGGAREVGVRVQRRLGERTAAAQQEQRGGGRPPSISRHGSENPRVTVRKAPDSSKAAAARQRRRPASPTSNSPSNPPTELPPTNTRNFPGSTTNFMSLL